MTVIVEEFDPLANKIVYIPKYSLPIRIAICMQAIFVFFFYEMSKKQKNIFISIFYIFATNSYRKKNAKPFSNVWRWRPSDLRATVLMKINRRKIKSTTVQINRQNCRAIRFISLHLFFYVLFVCFLCCSFKTIETDANRLDSSITMLINMLCDAS